ncbi:MAG: DUF362 domain-containing protein [Bacteroidetes bacterium]|nr:DUF362 domain-containing protein [Bacteroidota bacterium]MCL5025054.1 DUF362 domain-containing protein [Chloroflexota bacterium]
MASKVYFMNDRSASAETSLVSKMLTVFDAADLGSLIEPGNVVAIKLHCGEYNNTAYLRPVYARALADKIKSLGGRPFVCDTTTLPYAAYSSRATALDIMLTAERNGLNSGTLGCPFICADGYLGTDDTRIDLPEGVILKEAYIAKAIALADVLIALTHFKGHGGGVFGGAIKNLGIGAQSKRGKMNVHQGMGTFGINASAFYPHLCNGTDCPTWEACNTICPYGVISIEDHTMRFEADKCCGCAACQGVVTCGVLEAPMERNDAGTTAIADGALGAVKAVGREKCGFVNLAIDIAPACDCAGFSDRSIVPNIGVFASKDPVAIDQACLDKVTAAAAIPGSRAEEAGVSAAGVPKFAAASCRWGSSEFLQINGGLRNGLGTNEYELLEVPPADARQFVFQWDPRPVGIRLRRAFEKEKVYPEGGFHRNEAFDLELVR